jgi:hypothetical protein
MAWFLFCPTPVKDSQTEIHTAEPLVPEPSSFEVETTTEKLKRHKSPGTDQFSAKLIQVGGNTERVPQTH